MLINAIHQVYQGDQKSEHITIDYSSQQIDLSAPEENISHDNNYNYRAPVYVGNDILGWILATGNLEGLNTLKRQVWINTIIVSAISAACTSLIFMLSLRHFSRTLNKIIYFAKDLENNLDTEISVHSNILELSILQNALNTTSHTLAEKFQQIEDAEARKTAILEASIDCLITIDDQGAIIDFNPSAELTFGYKKEQAIGKKFAALIIPENKESFCLHDIVNYPENRDSDTLLGRTETTALRSSGDKFPIELSVVPFISNGKSYFLSSIRDISKRKRLEEKQKQTNSLLNQTLHELKLRQKALDEHAIVSISDAAGNIIYVNEKFINITGYSEDELLGKNHRILRSGRQSNDFYDDLWNTIIHGDVWHGEICNRRKNGSNYWVTSTIVPLMDETSHKISQIISIHTDITANKENEIQLAEYHEHQKTLIEQYQKSEHELAIAHNNQMMVGHQVQRTLLFGNIPNHIDQYSLAVHSEPSKGVDGDFYEFFNFGT